jgi:hypothetical protein
MRYDLDLRHGEILTKILTSKTRTLSTPRKGGRPVREFVDASWTSRGQGPCSPKRILQKHMKVTRL